MNETERDQILFSVTNHHVASSGQPPHINDGVKGQYRGYFENEHGDQAIFIYDRATRQGTLYMGDAGWEHPHDVENGTVPTLVMNMAERAWLAACWSAAKAFER